MSQLQRVDDRIDSLKKELHILDDQISYSLFKPDDEVFKKRDGLLRELFIAMDMQQMGRDYM